MPLSVPGNSSRSFQTYLEAVTQPRGWFQFGWTPEDPYLRNTKYEAGLIQFDRAYCTAVCGIDGSNSIPTLDYFFDSVLPIMERPTRVTDVGCGQGEFVRALRDQGVEAVGFDPVLQESCSYLFAELWSADLTPDTNLIVMRCVLPHIADPWSFLAEVATQQSSAIVLIEFQRIEWIIDNCCWYQFCHDHLNQFSIDDFVNRYSIIKSGQFGNGEWGWVLFDPKSYRPSFSHEFSFDQELAGVLDVRGSWLRSQVNKKLQRFIWGGAAKGTVLADALVRSGAAVSAVVDAGLQKSGRFLEGSGVQVISPAELLTRNLQGVEVLVANPNHFGAVRDFLIATPADVRLTN